MVKKRKRFITVHNRNFENYKPWLKGLVFGGLMGFILAIIFFVLTAFLDYNLSLENLSITLIPFFCLIIGTVLGSLFFREYK
jgi:hypothetical protein